VRRGRREPTPRAARREPTPRADTARRSPLAALRKPHADVARRRRRRPPRADGDAARRRRPPRADAAGRGRRRGRTPEPPSRTDVEGAIRASMIFLGFGSPLAAGLSPRAAPRIGSCRPRDAPT